MQRLLWHLWTYTGTNNGMLQKATDANQQSTSAYRKHGHSFMDKGGLRES